MRKLGACQWGARWQGAGGKVHGRNRPCGRPPAQIRTRAFGSYGSYLGCLAWNRTHPVQPTRRETPARCPVRGWLAGSHWDLPVLGHRVSAHARVFDSVGPDRHSPLARRPAWPSRPSNPVGAPRVVIPELNGWPMRNPIHASPATLPPPAHDTGSAVRRIAG